jgi:hypothetical protein
MAHLALSSLPGSGTPEVEDSSVPVGRWMMVWNYLVGPVHKGGEELADTLGESRQVRQQAEDLEAGLLALGFLADGWCEPGQEGGDHGVSRARLRQMVTSSVRK